MKIPCGLENLLFYYFGHFLVPSLVTTFVTSAINAIAVGVIIVMFELFYMDYWLCLDRCHHPLRWSQ